MSSITKQPATTKKPHNQPVTHRDLYTTAVTFFGRSGKLSRVVGVLVADLDSVKGKQLEFLLSRGESLASREYWGFQIFMAEGGSE